MVEVQMAVHHHGDVVEADSGRRQCLLQRAAAWPVVRLGLGVRVADAGVEEDQSVAVSYEVGEDGFGPWL
ncbi:hypothetical protein GCM10010233_51370 [Streptomyces pseudogriseolus]|nr:hypothetical protein GCM10010233_51370 [Streptomyces gancidicus]